MKPQGYIPPSAPPGAHEGADIDFKLIRRVACFLAVTILVVVVVLALFFQSLERTYPARTSEAAPRVTTVELPPAPRLQTHPLLDLQAVRAAEDLHLNRYGWVDRQQGVAQIPIERAMDLWPQSYSVTPTKASPAPTELEMRQEKAQEGSHVP